MQAVDQGYGLVCDSEGTPYPDLIVAETTQEQGILAIRSGCHTQLPSLPVGTLVRILPNHACATAAQFDRYHVLDGSGHLAGEWRRFSGW